jgi:hypothetical protein
MEDDRSYQRVTHFLAKFSFGHNKSGDEFILMEFSSDVTLFKANPKYYFLISYNW